MKKLLAWILLAAMVIGVFAGCNKKPDETTGPSGSTGPNVVDTADMEAALEYVVTIYRKVAEKTPKDFERIANVPINGVNYEVVWTVDVGEDTVKIVKGENGMVTIDINEEVTEDTKYVLTATITDAAGNTVSHKWNHFIPAASDSNMIAIVEEAYALAPGASLGYEATLTGKIVAVNTPYDAGYQNVTVTIAVAGAEDKPIQCYRLKGDGADIIKAGYTITVTGTLKNYNGTIEFDAGCTLDSYVEGEPDAAPTDPMQIIEEAYALAPGGVLPYEATLTGEIISIDTPYSEQYSNITVTIEVNGAAGKPIQCYRLSGEGADKLKETDVITVTGSITNYNGTVQFGQGCQLISVTEGSGVQQPEDPKQVVDEAYALEPGQSLPYTATLTGTVTEVNYSYKEENGNMSVTMTVSGRSSKPIYCYMMTGKAADLTKVSKGCTITVRGTIKKFEDWNTGEIKVEFEKPTLISCKVPSVAAGSEVKLNDGDVIVIYNPANAVALSSKKSYDGSFYNAGVLVSGSGTNLKGHGASERWTVKVNANGTYSFSNGGQNIGMDDSFTSTPQGGKHDQWELIYQGGGKYLIRNTGRDAYLEWYAGQGSWSGYNPKDGSQSSDPLFLQSIFVYKKSETPVEPATLADAVAEIETYKEKDLTTTALPTELSMKGDTKFTVVWTVSGTDKITVTDNGDGTASLVFPEEITEDIAYKLTYVVTAADNTTETATWDLVAEKVEDIAVLTVKEVIELGLSQEHNIYTEEKYQVTGVITEVYNTTYGNMKISDGTNILTIYGTYDADGSNRYDAMDVKPVAGDVVTIVGIVGQYSGTAQIKNGWITVHYPALTVEEAITLGQSKEHNNYTEEKYAVTGKITEVYNTTYGNMKITDEAGNILTIYGTYDIDGTNRYDKMEAKPVAGDTVTIVGIVGQYSGTAQVKNGWIIAHTVAETDEGEGGEGGETETPTASISFADVANRTSQSSSQQVWAQNGITVTNDKAASSTNIGDYSNPARFYQSTSLKIEYAGMTKIVVTCDDYKTTYPTALQSSITDTNATVTVDGVVVTIEFANAVDSFVIDALSAQVRVDSIDVYAVTTGGEGGETPDPTPDPDPEPEPEPSGTTYTKVTEASQFTTGKYVMIVSSGYAPTYEENGWLLSATLAAANNTITDPVEDHVWTLTVSGDSVKLTDSKGNTIAPKGGNNNGIAVGDYDWAWTFDDSADTFVFSGVGADTVTLAANTVSSSKFRGYKNATVNGNADGYPSLFTLYKLAEAE